MTQDLSSQSDDDRIDVTVGAAKQLLIFAYKRYSDAMKSGDTNIATYWDGCIRGIQYILEAQHE